ncbi:hypothetical protein B0H19DRAFT_1334988 [Mycena capillaripes]|nr:hypothetical protein B0H19DRAFT_1334988 [Mycena capillaripes]
MYFGRGAYDKEAEAEARLKSFSGRTGIGSDEYFGKEGGPDGPRSSGSSSYAGGWLEATARDVIGRMLANLDVQNVGDGIRSGTG